MDQVHQSQAQLTENILVWKDDQEEASGSRQGLHLHTTSSSSSRSSSYSAAVIIPPVQNTGASPTPLSENLSFNPNTPSKLTQTTAAAAARKQKNGFTVIYTPNPATPSSTRTSTHKKTFRGQQKSAVRGTRSARKNKNKNKKAPSAGTPAAALEHVQISNQQTPGTKKNQKSSSSDEAVTTHTPKIAAGTHQQKRNKKTTRSGSAAAKSKHKQKKSGGADEIDFKIGDLSERLSSLKKELNSVALRSTRKKSPVPHNHHHSVNSRSTKLSVKPLASFSTTSKPAEKTPTRPTTATAKTKQSLPSSSTTSEPAEKTPTRPTTAMVETKQSSKSLSSVQSSENKDTARARDPDAVIAGVIRDIDLLAMSSSQWSSAPTTPKEGTAATSSTSLHATKSFARTTDDLQTRPAATPNTSAVNSAVGAALDAALEQSTKFGVPSNSPTKPGRQKDQEQTSSLPKAVVLPAIVEQNNQFSTSLNPSTAATHSTTHSVHLERGSSSSSENANGVLTMDAMRANLKRWNETIRASKAALKASRGTATAGSQDVDAEASKAGCSAAQFPIKKSAAAAAAAAATTTAAKPMDHATGVPPPKPTILADDTPAASFTGANGSQAQSLESGGAQHDTSTENRSGPTEDTSRTSTTHQNSTGSPLPTWKHTRIRTVTLQHLQAKSAENSSRLQRSINELLLALVAAGAATIDLNLPCLGKASLLQPASGWKVHCSNDSNDNEKTAHAPRKKTQQKHSDASSNVSSHALVVAKPVVTNASTARSSTTMADAFLVHSTAIKALFGEAVAKSQSILQHLRSRKRSWNLSFLDKMPTVFGDGDIDEASRAVRRRIFVPSAQSSAFATSDSNSTSGSTQRRHPKPVQGLVACQGCAALVDPDDSKCRACQTPISITLKWQAVPV